jgi:ribose 5-phosphate isomerase B
MKIAIASDHAGFELKEKLKLFLKEHKVSDFGPFNTDSMDYPDTGFAAAESVSSGDCERGILICGTGLGMSYVGNKVPGIRAALCHTKQFAELSREHNDANVLVLSGRFISEFLAKEIVQTWLATDFAAGRHQKRIDKIKKYERRN